MFAHSSSLDRANLPKAHPDYDADAVDNWLDEWEAQQVVEENEGGDGSDEDDSEHGDLHATGMVYHGGVHWAAGPPHKIACE